MSEKEYKERFKILYELLIDAHLYFYTWKGLIQDKGHEKYWERNENFWNTIIRSIRNSFLQAIANIYEDSSFSKKGKVISVYSLASRQRDKKRKEKVKSLLSSNRKIIENVSVVRSNQLSHINAKHFQNPRKLFRKFPIKFKEIENLLGLTDEVLHLLCYDDNHNFDFEILEDSCERDSTRIMVKIKYYTEEEKKHYERVRSGKTPYSNFPP